MNVFKDVAKRALSIRQGFFPETLERNEKFEVIVFNDVFQHIANVESVLAACSTLLKPGGMLVLNLPSSQGAFYRIARFLSRLGCRSFFDRLWQRKLPSPYLHYFSSKNLPKLLENSGFEEVNVGRLPTLRLKGLYT